MKTINSMEQFQKTVDDLHKKLPQELRFYLHERCITDDVINKFKIGYDKTSKALTIPIPDDSGAYLFFRYRRDPRLSKGEPKYWHTIGEKHHLYGLENLNGFSREYVVLCEGEFDRLALESIGIPAVTSTGGAGTFNQEWLSYFKSTGRVFICYDKDTAGIKNADAVSKLIPNSKVVMLPEIDGGGKDITEYLKSGKTKNDFNQLLNDAKTNEELQALAMIESLKILGKPVIFNPSQEVIANKLYFTVPVYIKNDDEKSKNPLKKVFFVIDSGRSIMQFNSAKEFLDKTGFYIKQMPSVKNQDVRWDPKYFHEFIDGYKPDPYEVFIQIVEVFKKYCEFKNEQDYEMVSLWTIGTYLFQTFDTYPYLGFNGLQSSGKTKVLDVLSFLAFNAQKVVNISEASLFRDVESLRSTIILDECEGLNDRKKFETLFSLLNSGYAKGTCVSRQESDIKGEFATRYFETFSPKVMANISGFETVLGTRMINVTMLRAKVDSTKGYIRPGKNTDSWDKFRNDLYSFALSSFCEVKDSYSNSDETKINNNRSNDLWSPILSIAKVIFKERPEMFVKFKSYAQEQIEKSSQNGLDSKVTTLLIELRDLVMRDDWYYVRDIKQKVWEHVEEEERDAITAEWVGHRIKNLGLDNDKDRDTAGVKYKLKRAEIIDLLERYSISSGWSNSG